MASYTLNTTDEQETVMAWWLRQRAASAAPHPYAGPTTTKQQLVEWILTNFRPIEDRYYDQLNAYRRDEFLAAAPADTKEQIEARAIARMG